MILSPGSSLLHNTRMLPFAHPCGKTAWLHPYSLYPAQAPSGHLVPGQCMISICPLSPVEGSGLSQVELGEGPVPSAPQVVVLTDGIQPV